MKRVDGEETRRKIVLTALEFFVRKGYHATSISDIMNKVGLSKGALYAHFKSKGEILLFIIERFKARAVDEMIQFVNDGEGNALDKLNRCISFNARFATEHENLCVFLTFLTTELKADVDFEPLLKGVYRDYRDFISGIIRQGIIQGVVDKKTDPDLAALTFMALHDGVLHQWVLNRGLIDTKQYVKTFREIFIYGLASDKGRTKPK
ncbi:MAG: TetR/AcrR family transcriptional regulator [Desulfotomaculaceae bacterium]|nr:TetR/AcrR family transcriptional regulator [Desulfotomaculaceae bacterium]